MSKLKPASEESVRTLDQLNQMPPTIPTYAVEVAEDKMPKPTTEELILKELRAIRSLMEGFSAAFSAAFASRTELKQEPRARAPAPHMKIMGVDENIEQRR